TASAPITFKSDQRWGAKLTCTIDQAFFFIDASYIIVDGFDMSCPGTSTGAYSNAMTVYGANNGHNTFSHNYIHDISNSHCGISGAISDGGTLGFNTYDGNVIHHIGYPANPTASSQCDHGIYAGVPYDVIINNIVSGAVGLGIEAFGGGVCHQIIA